MKRSEYEAKAKEFHALLDSIAALPVDQQVWPEYEDWLSIPGTSTCTTPTCAVFGIADRVTLHENADSVFRASCGVCGTSITPVPVFEEE